MVTRIKHFKKRLLFDPTMLLLKSESLNIMCCGSGVVTQACPTRVTPWTVAHQPPLSMGFAPIY